MHTLTVISLITVWLSYSVDGLVYHATLDDFDRKVLKPGSSWFVEFYAPWCGHCKAFEPIYLNASEDSRLANKVQFAAVDITAEKPLAERYNVSRFPTVLFLENGIVYEYNGRRNEEDMIAYGLAMNKDPLIRLSSSSKLTLNLGMTYLVVTPDDQTGLLNSIIKRGMKPVRPWLTAFTLDFPSLEGSNNLRDMFNLNTELFDEYRGKNNGKDSNHLMLVARSKFDRHSAVSVIKLPSLNNDNDDTKKQTKNVIKEISSFFKLNQFGTLTRIKSSPMDERSGVLKSSVFRDSKLVTLLIIDTPMPENNDLLSHLKSVNDREHGMIELIGSLSASHPEWRVMVPSSDAGRDNSGNDGDSMMMLHRCTFAIIEYNDFKEYLTERFGLEVSESKTEDSADDDDSSAQQSGLSLPLILFYDTDLQAYYTIDYSDKSSSNEQLLTDIISGNMESEMTYVNSFIVRKVMALEQWLNGMKPWQMIVFFLCVFISIFALMVSIDYCCGTEQHHYRRPPIKDD